MKLWSIYRVQADLLAILSEKCYIGLDVSIFIARCRKHNIGAIFALYRRYLEHWHCLKTMKKCIVPLKKPIIGDETHLPYVCLILFVRKMGPYLAAQK